MARAIELDVATADALRESSSVPRRMWFVRPSRPMFARRGACSRKGLESITAARAMFRSRLVTSCMTRRGADNGLDL